jgi:hypothetical protein
MDENGSSGSVVQQFSGSLFTLAIHAAGRTLINENR